MLAKIQHQVVLLATALITLTLLSVAHAGQGYREIQPPVPTANTEKVEVLEYFWFGCPHCYAFEPTINRWAEDKPDYVEFVREAPPLNPGWIAHSQAFYAAEIMGVTDKMFDQMFDAIHKEKRRLRKPEAIAAFVGELGIDSDKFLKTMNSFAVRTRMQQALARAQQSGITGVPSVVINGKYLTGNSLAGGHEGIVRVINERIEIERNSGS